MSGHFLFNFPFTRQLYQAGFEPDGNREWTVSDSSGYDAVLHSPKLLILGLKYSISNEARQLGPVLIVAFQSCEGQL